MESLLNKIENNDLNEASFEAALKAIAASKEKLFIKPKYLAIHPSQHQAFNTFLLNHESNIAIGMNDFGDLREVFKEINKRDAK